jgi:hypothetical protein
MFYYFLLLLLFNDENILCFLIMIKIFSSIISPFKYIYYEIEENSYLKSVNFSLKYHFERLPSAVY